MHFPEVLKLICSTTVTVRTLAWKHNSLETSVSIRPSVHACSHNMCTWVLDITMAGLLSQHLSHYISTNTHTHTHTHARGKEMSFQISLGSWICIWGCFWTRHRRALVRLSAFLLEYKQLFGAVWFPSGFCGQWQISYFLWPLPSSSVYHRKQQLFPVL